MKKFKLKAKTNTGGSGFPIKKGMEVIVESNSSRPNAKEVINALNEQHNLSLSSATSVNLGQYEIETL